MKVLVKQTCQFGEVTLKGSKQKPGTQNVPAFIVFEPYFSMLLKEGKLQILSFTDKDSEQVEEFAKQNKVDIEKICPAVAAAIKGAAHEADEEVVEPAADSHLKIELEEAHASIETLQAKVEAHEAQEQKLGEELLQLTSDKQDLEAQIVQLKKENEEHIAEKADLAAKLEKAKKK